MSIAVRSFAKINIGLCIGPRRDDGFHELRTVYQTIAMCDILRVDVGSGVGIEIRCKDPRVPTDESNTCHRIAERVLKFLKKRGKVVIQIEKKLPVQGGLGAASSNAVATLLALERLLKKPMQREDKLQIAAEVGSDLPLFLAGGTVMGAGRGEQVLPLDDMPALSCVVATPAVGVSTPWAFQALDELTDGCAPKLTHLVHSDRMNKFCRSICAWLTGTSGVPVGKDGDRAETLLLDLVRTGIENDFERVVFPKYPELREVKRVLERTGARYASLSGSGSALYGLMDSPAAAEKAVAALASRNVVAVATTTLTRAAYWKKIFVD